MRSTSGWLVRTMRSSNQRWSWPQASAGASGLPSSSPARRPVSAAAPAGPRERAHRAVQAHGGERLGVARARGRSRRARAGARPAHAEGARSRRRSAWAAGTPAGAGGGLGGDGRRRHRLEPGRAASAAASWALRRLPQPPACLAAAALGFCLRRSRRACGRSGRVRGLARRPCARRLAGRACRFRLCAWSSAFASHPLGYVMRRRRRAWSTAGLSVDRNTDSGDVSSRADDARRVAHESARVEDRVEVELRRGLGQQVADGVTPSLGALGVLLHHPVGVVARAARLDQRQQRPLGVERAVGERRGWPACGPRAPIIPSTTRIARCWA